ncbi:dockerin type I repeat-containing protein [Ruminococcus sp.]|uniref:dockerin type I repeat-containing protein n=1 Tax=Ruminococcus sp. TaxID=41978 RepID=UPI00263806CC|nr:dockerin type I repeat-containing protein [Ruminococcus sp.]MDD6989713.1 dockerin type I repeat-containing protein [Ruminococcus sp.]MDY6201852.1 dockerin type I repeat-containing protein [Ruminococcus sp.]
MKKIISILLSSVMLLSIWSCFAVSAATEPYPPLETGHYGSKELKKYSYKTPGNDPISFDDACMLQVDKFKKSSALDDESVENQIKEDYIANVDNDADIEKMEINYYGTLSDGSMLVFVDCKYYYGCVVDYKVIGKYVYYTPTKDETIVVYKNHEFTEILDAYQKGTLTDELLDETAEILCFAKFVNPNEEPETPVLYGDVDNDGVITVLDATLVQKLGLGIEEPESELTSVLADVNNDGRISVLDVTCIQKFITGGYSNTGRTGVELEVVG